MISYTFSEDLNIIARNKLTGIVQMSFLDVCPSRQGQGIEAERVLRGLQQKRSFRTAQSQDQTE